MTIVFKNQHHLFQGLARMLGRLVLQRFIVASIHILIHQLYYKKKKEALHRAYNSKAYPLFALISCPLFWVYRTTWSIQIEIIFWRSFSHENDTKIHIFTFLSSPVYFFFTSSRFITHSCRSLPFQKQPLMLKKMRKNLTFNVIQIFC